MQAQQPSVFWIGAIGEAHPNRLTSQLTAWGWSLVQARRWLTRYQTPAHPLHDPVVWICQLTLHASPSLDSALHTLLSAYPQTLCAAGSALDLVQLKDQLLQLQKSESPHQGWPLHRQAFLLPVLQGFGARALSALAVDTLWHVEQSRLLCHRRPWAAPKHQGIESVPERCLLTFARVLSRLIQSIGLQCSDEAIGETLQLALTRGICHAYWLAQCVVLLQSKPSLTQQITDWMSLIRLCVQHTPDSALDRLLHQQFAAWPDVRSPRSSDACAPLQAWGRALGLCLQGIDFRLQPPLGGSTLWLKYNQAGLQDTLHLDHAQSCSHGDQPFWCLVSPGVLPEAWRSAPLVEGADSLIHPQGVSAQLQEAIGLRHAAGQQGAWGGLQPAYWPLRLEPLVPQGFQRLVAEANASISLGASLHMVDTTASHLRWNLTEAGQAAAWWSCGEHSPQIVNVQTSWIDPVTLDKALSPLGLRCDQALSLQSFLENFQWVLKWQKELDISGSDPANVAQISLRLGGRLRVQRSATLRWSLQGNWGSGLGFHAVWLEAEADQAQVQVQQEIRHPYKGPVLSVDGPLWSAQTDWSMVVDQQHWPTPEGVVSLGRQVLFKLRLRVEAQRAANGLGLETCLRLALVEGQVQVWRHDPATGAESFSRNLTEPIELAQWRGCTHA